MNELLAALWRAETPLVYGTALALAALVHRFMPSGRVTARHALLTVAACALLDTAAEFLPLRAPVAAGLRQAAVLGLGVVLIRLSGLLLFRVGLPALHLRPPRILEDIVVIAAYVLWGMVRLSLAGVDLTSLVATSAVITAVIAFAMQDTLGNVLGGLALQLDDSLAIGDWVRVDDVSGRVVEIQWRYTAVLTRNGEKVVIPNGQLMKGKFTVIGADGTGPGAGVWRRWVWFNVDYSVPPSQVALAAEQALGEAEVANVARTPAPSCVAMEFAPGSVRYALRYWLLDPRDDDATDSAVRLHVLAAVQRKGWRIALPDQVVHVVQEGQAHREAVWQRELARRVQALAGVDLFATLDEGERRQIAERMVHAPFARGDLITRQGAEAHWLYVIAGGEAEVFWEAPGGQRRLLTRVGTGSLCGEMGLLTGAPRSATVVAATDMECYRLDKASFQDIIHKRHAIAENMSHILAQRQMQNEAMKSEFNKAQGLPDSAQHRADILRRIREFFGLP